MATALANEYRVRKSFGKIKQIIEIPNLIEMQRQSYERFLQSEVDPDERIDKGLQGVFKGVFPIRDFSGTASLEFGFGIMATEDTRDQLFIEEAEDAVSEEEEEDGDEDEEFDAVLESADEPFDDAETAADFLLPMEPTDESFTSDTEAKAKRRRPRRRSRLARQRRAAACHPRPAPQSPVSGFRRCRPGGAFLS